MVRMFDLIIRGIHGFGCGVAGRVEGTMWGLLTFFRDQIVVAISALNLYFTFTC